MGTQDIRNIDNYEGKSVFLIPYHDMDVCGYANKMVPRAMFNKPVLVKKVNKCINGSVSSVTIEFGSMLDEVEIPINSFKEFQNID